MSDNQKRIGVVLLLALGLRLLLFLAVGSWRTETHQRRYVHVDSLSYQQLALNLIENRVFSSSEEPPFEPETYWTPAYPVYLAAVFSVAGGKPYAAIFLQLLIGSATCLLVYSIGKTVFDKRVALLAGLISGLEYSGIFYSNVLLTETLFTFLFAAHVFSLIQFLSTDKNKWMAASAILLGLSTLTRPVCIYFPVFLCVVFFYHFRSNLKRGLVKYLVFVLIFLVAIIPWMTRNFSVSGKFLVSSAQEEVLNWTVYKVIDSFKADRPPSRRGGSVTDLDQRREAQEKAPGKSVLGAVLETSKKYAFASVRFFFTPSSGALPGLLGLPSQEMEKIDWSSKKPWNTVVSAMKQKSALERFIFVFVVCFLSALYLTAFLGILKSLKKFREESLLFILIITYFALSSVAFTWTMRYRVPIMPYVILFSSFGCVYLYERFRQNREAKKIPENIA